MAKVIPKEAIEAIVSRKIAIRDSPKYLLWALINMAAAAFFYVDLTKWEACSCLFVDPGSRAWGGIVWKYCEMAVVLVFLICCSANVFLFIRPRLGYPAIRLDERQRGLLGIKEGEPGFDLLPPPPATPVETPPTSPSKQLFVTPVSSISSSSGSVTPMNLSASSWMTSGSSSPYSPGGSPWSPFSYTEPRASFYVTDSSMSTPGSTKSEPIPSSPRVEFENRLKREKDAIRNQDSFETSDFISSPGQLARYLNDTASYGRRNVVPYSRSLSNSFHGFGDVNHGIEQVEATPPRRFLYQMAPTSSSTPGSAGRRKDEASSVSSMDTVVFARGKLGITPEKLDVWTEHLRKWISETIFRPVNKEIEAINEKLKSLGAGESNRIGSMSLSQVAGLTVTGYPGVGGSADFSSLHTLLPFLEAHPNQEYLVKRIATLAKKGYLGDYRWNGGESYEGKSWGDHLPTDALIVMHLFASYFDVHLPLTTFGTPPRPFTYYYFLKKSPSSTSPSNPSSSAPPAPSSSTPSSSSSAVAPPGVSSSSSSTPSSSQAASLDLTTCVKVQTSCGPVVLPDRMRDTPVIYQGEVSPPHFVFIHRGEACEAAKGRNNLFHTLLLFLHRVKTENGGMLGRVNLGLSGINVLWILD